MKKYLIFLVFFFTLFNTAFGQKENDPYVKAEKEINSVYQKILREYGSDKEFIKNLRASQRLWIQFRDAEIKARYPNQTPGYYGSIYPSCLASLKAQLTNDRIKTLSVWLEGIEEGDVCAGSVKMKR